MSERPSLLVIGDDFNKQSPLLQYLEREIEFLFAASADQVIDITSDGESLDLILLDIISLGDRAVETCQWLKTDNEVKHVPIVVFGELEEEVSRWISCGVSDYLCLTTPVGLAATRIKTLLELKFKTDLLADIASLDPLTTLPNRQRLDEYLNIEWRRSLREYYPMSLIKIDIDGFGEFNDRYGIGTGDEVLRRIARVLQAHCNRAGDMVSRYGDDEFMVLLPSIELDKALLLAEKLILSVKELSITNEQSGSAGVITLSAGVATIEPSRDKRFQDLFDETDEMLYRAQEGGGDQAQGISL